MFNIPALRKVPTNELMNVRKGELVALIDDMREREAIVKAEIKKCMEIFPRLTFELTAMGFEPDDPITDSTDLLGKGILAIQSMVSFMGNILK